MNETLSFIKTYLSFYSLKGPQLVVWEIDGETYTQREDFFFPYLLLGAKGCQRLHPLQARQRRPDRLRVPRSTTILCTLSKFDRVVITWSPSGYTPVRPECPDAPSFSCLLIKMWQLAKAHGVTRNEPKIHVICYITPLDVFLFPFFITSFAHFLIPNSILIFWSYILIISLRFSFYSSFS